MNKIIFFLIAGILSINCVGQNDGLLMPVDNTISISEDDTRESIILKAAHVVPTKNQYEALKNEFIAFIHFGPNTFTRREWGTGMEDPEIFDLKELDTDQWCEAMKAAGMEMVILTVKHHDGFVLWQSRYTDHGIMSTPFKDGKGDILKELSESCRKYGLKLGVYLSPADLYQIENPDGLYGNLSPYTERTIPRPVPGRPFENKTTFQFKVDDYNEYFLNQLFELLTEYGPIHEVWFDGAHPKRKGGQKYHYAAWKELIRTLAPEAVIFGREDIRWVGNESGGTRTSEWNIIPYPEDPNTATNFPDLTAESPGSRENLYKANYLHYQQAETNTSIREGWFYRDDTRQKVRSADDVFDIYERSVGGNSTFLLNIPPNREGKFSPEDVAVLKEVGKRIRETYGEDVFRNAEGPQEVLDEDMSSYQLLKEKDEIILTTAAPVTINRLVLQEAIRTHGERVERHALDAWINGEWKEIATATNIGYKRILRFPEVTSQKFRVRVLQSRFLPAISNISAHYYKNRPPQLEFARDVNGSLSIEPLETGFNWKPHGEDISKNLGSEYEIYYTLNGTDPDTNSSKYNGSFLMLPGEIKAVAIGKNGTGAVASREFGLLKKDWKILETSSEAEGHAAKMAIDANEETYWQSKNTSAPHFMVIDLGKEYSLKGFAYTPQKQHAEGMIAKGKIKISQDGKSWRDAEEFEFGNLVNDPNTRTHYFKDTIVARFVRIEATEIAEPGKSAAIAEIEFFIE